MKSPSYCLILVQCDARISWHLEKIAWITSGFLWFCQAFCDLVHIQSVIELFAKRQNHALNVPLITKRRQNHKLLVLPGFLPGFLLKIRPDSARIFTKMRPDEELVTLKPHRIQSRNRMQYVIGIGNSRPKNQCLVHTKAFFLRSQAAQMLIILITSQKGYINIL